MRRKLSFVPRAEGLETKALLSVVAVKPTAAIKAAAQVTSASFVSKTVLDHTVESYYSGFTQTFKLKNTGNTTWTGLQLVFVSGSDRLGAASSVSVPTTAPGATASINVSLQANKTSGSGAAQLAYWQLKNGSTVIPISGAYNNKIWTAITVDSPIGPGYPRLKSSYYTTGNPYFKAGLGDQCTAFVWGRVAEMNYGIPFPCTGAAGKPWIDAAHANHYQVSQTPRANSIAVWNGAIPHVAYVESVSGNTVVISEANHDSYSSYAALNDPTGAHTWGGGYDGNSKYLTASDIRNRGSFLGYIYI